MATRKDLLKAQSFTSRRMIAAFVDRDPEDPTPPLRRVATATFVSVLVGIILLAGTALIGMLSGGASASSWAEEDGVIISDTQSGVLFVYQGKKLYPMEDVASARLKAAGDNPEGAPRVIEVKTDALRGIAQEPASGIPGAPRQLPAAKDLESYPIRVCSSAPAGAQRRYLTLEFGSAEPASRDLSFVAEADNGKQYLVSGGKTHELYSRPGQSSSLAQNLPVVKPGNAWIFALPTGLPINPISLEGVGTPALNSPKGTASVGQMFVVEDSSPKRYYVQLQDGLAAISYLDMKLTQQVANVPENLISIKDADLVSAKSSTESVSAEGIPMFEMSGPPGYTSLGDASVCATFSAEDPSRVALSVGQATPEIPNTQGAPRGNTFDLITLPSLSGALLRNADSITEDGASTLLAGGKKYQIPSAREKAALGYKEVSPVPVPGGLLSLLPSGLSSDGASLSASSIESTS